jgi:hypothetical protein
MIQAVAAAEGYSAGSSAVGVELREEGDGLGYAVTVLKEGVTQSLVVMSDGTVREG